MAVEKLTSKIQNYQYMPGISSYGVDGKKGEIGTSGNCVFFSNIIFDTTSDENQELLQQILTKIKNQQLLLKNDSTTISRPYQNGDYIILSNGKIYEIANIEHINEITGKTFKDFFILKGKINNISDINNSINNSEQSEVTMSDNGSLVFHHKLNIGEPLSTDNDNSDYMLRITSDDESNGLVKFIRFLSKYDIENDAYLNFYYDINKDAFFMDSNHPVFFNTPSLTIKGSSNSVYDDYSSVVTYDSDTSITQKYAQSKNIKYRYTLLSNRYINSVTLTYPTNVLQTYFSNASFCVTYTTNTNQIKKYIFTYDDLLNTKTMTGTQVTMSLKLADLTASSGYFDASTSRLTVSIIDRLEFFISPS